MRASSLFDGNMVTRGTKLFHGYTVTSGNNWSDGILNFTKTTKYERLYVIRITSSLTRFVNGTSQIQVYSDQTVIKKISVKPQISS